MQYLLANLFKATLENFGMSEDYWETNRRSRSREITFFKQIFCFTAIEMGYSIEKAGKLMHMRRTTVVKYAEEPKSRMGAEGTKKAREVLNVTQKSDNT